MEPSPSMTLYSQFSLADHLLFSHQVASIAQPTSAPHTNKLTQMAQVNSNNKKSNSQTNTNSANKVSTKKGKPMIVERVNKIPVVQFAVAMGFSQYDKLKSSNITVGDVMSRAEGWAAYVWEMVQPIVEKLQEPISRADQLACHTLDFVEDKLTTMKIPQTINNIVPDPYQTLCRYVPTARRISETTQPQKS